MTETDVTIIDSALAALNTALAALADAKLSPQPDPSVVEILGHRVVEAAKAALAADPEIDVVEDNKGRWVAIRTT